MTVLEPPDTRQCQADVKEGSFMTLGPRSWRRCTNVPTVIATETKPGEDGLVGSMSLCPECKKVAEGKFPPGFLAFTDIPTADHVAPPVPQQ